MEFKTEFIGGSTPEQVKLELTFKELTGKNVNIIFRYSFFFYFPRYYVAETKVFSYVLTQELSFHLNFGADISAVV